VACNGTVRQYDGDPAMPDLWYLRDLLELTGAKFGCGKGLCGALPCMWKAKPRSCVTNMSDVAGKRITTIEGLSAKVDDPYMLDTAHAPRDRNRSRAVRLGEKEARP
jgi:isoquinoline 1-oxidoreductase alpha subunit